MPTYSVVVLLFWFMRILPHSWISKKSKENKNNNTELTPFIGSNDFRRIFVGTPFNMLNINSLFKEIRPLYYCVRSNDTSKYTLKPRAQECLGASLYQQLALFCARWSSSFVFSQKMICFMMNNSLRLNLPFNFLRWTTSVHTHTKFSQHLVRSAHVCVRLRFFLSY